jgi:hypothetical protein
MILMLQMYALCLNIISSVGKYSYGKKVLWSWALLTKVPPPSFEKGNKHCPEIINLKQCSIQLTLWPSKTIGLIVVQRVVHMCDAVYGEYMSQGSRNVLIFNLQYI